MIRAYSICLSRRNAARCGPSAPMTPCSASSHSLVSWGSTSLALVAPRTCSGTADMAVSLVAVTVVASRWIGGTPTFALILWAPANAAQVEFSNCDMVFYNAEYCGDAKQITFDVAAQHFPAGEMCVTKRFPQATRRLIAVTLGFAQLHRCPHLYLRRIPAFVRPSCFPPATPSRTRPGRLTPPNCPSRRCLPRPRLYIQRCPPTSFHPMRACALTCRAACG